MNNNLFVLGRYLRDKGIDCELIIFKNNIEHFFPNSDTYNEDYKRWTAKVEWGGSDEFAKTDKDTIRNYLKKYDVLIGCGLSPAYVKKAERELDIFIPYGSDIYEESKLRITKNLLKIIKINYAAIAQISGFACVKILHLLETNNLYEERAKKYFSKVERWNCGVPMVYHPQYENINPAEYLVNEGYYEITKLREQNDFILIYHGRNVWGKDKNNPNDKGTDKLIIGWSRFIKKNKLIKAKIILFEYGDDVIKTKKLISELKVENSVYWLKKDQRKNIVPILMMCDLSAAEFTHSWICSGIMYEALAVGVPIMAYRDDSSYSKHVINDLYGILNCKTSDDIEDKLEWALNNRKLLKQYGQEGKNWYIRKLVEPVVTKYVNFINSN